MTLELKSYPGGKGSDGVWQRIISSMPAHQNYFELFLGHGAIIRAKRGAPGLNVGVELDREVIDWWLQRPPSPHLTILQGDAIRTLSSHPAMADPNTLVYLDPPYLRSTRTRLLYAYEFCTPAQHLRLLKLIKRLTCMVMISGYWSRLYEHELRDWRVVSYMSSTRGGPRREFLWMNFPGGLPMHDVRFAGDGFRERARIKKKRDTWRRRFEAMDAAERQVILEALNPVASPEMAMRSASPGMARGT